MAAQPADAPITTTQPWTPDALPDLSGVVAVVTGANSGLGFHTALELARHGAHVVLTARDPERGDLALGQVRVQAPGASVELRQLDLADLASVRAFATGLLDGPGRVDVLVNNAGVMAVPRRLTQDGFELQLGTNHLGHFALTGLLLPALLGGSVLGGPSRVVTVSSLLHRRGRLSRDDLMGERRYTPYGAYGQSKLANLLFTYELQRRVTAPLPAGAAAPLASVAAHPGYAATNLQAVGPQMTGSSLHARLGSLGNRFLAQPAAHGAWPSLRAAGDPAARGGEFYGPGGFADMRGNPRLATPAEHALDTADAAWLWQRSVELTGVDYELLSRLDGVPGAVNDQEES
jgi:NAD(P)-dependent dehydrogenase (short-subunit alcohol dehydrogenase family)